MVAVQLYLREEIKGEALVRNLPGFARFLHGDVAREEIGHLLEGRVYTLLRTYMAERDLADLPGLRRRILVHRGARPTQTEDGIDAWRVETLLEALAEDRLWP